VPDPLRGARVVNAGREPIGDAEPALDLAQGEQAAVGRESPAVEAGNQGLVDHR
jgi:hypothetical protein